MTHLTPPLTLADDVALLTSALEKQGFTASDVEIAHAYTSYSIRIYSQQWVPIGFYVSVDEVAKRLVEWVKYNHWKETVT